VNVYRSALLCITIILCATTNSINSKYKCIIFDLGGVLIDYDATKLSFDLGLTDLLLYVTQEKQNPFKLLTRLLTIMNAHNEQVVQSEQELATVLGNVIPKGLCDLFCGKISNKAALQQALDILENPTQLQEPLSALEKKLLKKLAVALLEPQFSVNYFKPIESTLRILKQLSEKRNSNGNPEHTLVILSNWDQESFEKLLTYHKTKEIFSYFDKKNIFISAKIGTMKPHSKAFTKTLKKLKVKAHDCIFIDDQEENIKAACACGLTCIKINNKNGKALEQSLKELGAL